MSYSTGGIGTLTGLAGTITGAADTWRNYRNAYAGGAQKLLAEKLGGS